jgi:hypothetical protein
MEVTMTRTFPALAAFALVTVFASGPLLADPPDSPKKSNRNAAPATNLKSKPPQTTRCDCSNCSAEHCPPPVKQNWGCRTCDYLNGTKLTGLDAATRLGPVVTVILPSGALIDLR